jgi:hypothetical protein
LDASRSDGMAASSLFLSGVRGERIVKSDRWVDDEVGPGYIHIRAEDLRR